MTLAERIESVENRVVAAAGRSGRSRSDITLIAVSKNQPDSQILAGYELGLRDFGENRAQQLRRKVDLFADAGKKASWHFIGHLQRNKVKDVVGRAVMVQTVDREEVAQGLEKRLGDAHLDVLVQVNIGREEQKGGADPDVAIEFARRVGRSQQLRLRGLMAIPPVGEDPEPHFDRMAALSRQLQQTPEGDGAAELSMGMSTDFELAIAHGATIIRVGTALFGPRGSSEA